MHRLSSDVRCVTAALLVMLMLSTSNNVALVTISSTAQSHNAVTTLIWGNVIVATGAPAGNTHFSIVWNQNSAGQTTCVDVINVGNVDTTGNSVAVTTQDATSSRQDAPTLTFSTCTGGTWNQTANTCSGTSTSLGSVTNSTLNTTIALTVGQRITLQIVAARPKKATWTSTFSTTVSRSQIRAATVTNS